MLIFFWQLQRETNNNAVPSTGGATVGVSRGKGLSPYKGVSKGVSVGRAGLTETQES